MKTTNKDFKTGGSNKALEGEETSMGEIKEERISFRWGFLCFEVSDIGRGTYAPRDYTNLMSQNHRRTFQTGAVWNGVNPARSLLLSSSYHHRTCGLGAWPWGPHVALA